MGYSVELAPAAVRQFRKLARNIQLKLAGAINSLTDNPRPRGAVKLKGAHGVWRIREGDYRLIFEVREPDSIVLILRIAHRREAYR